MRLRLRFIVGGVIAATAVAVAVAVAAPAFGPPAAGRAARPAQYRIAVIIKTQELETNFFWRSLREGVDSAARDLGVDYEIVAAEKESDIDGQIRLAFEALERKPDAVVLAASDVQRLIPFAAEVRKRGIPLVGMDSFLSSDDAQIRIGTDNLLAGSKLGSVAKARLPEDAPIALMSYVATSSTAIERERGFRAAVADRLRIVETLYSESEQDKAYELTRDLLSRRKDIRALVTLNLPTTLGAARAVAASDRAGELVMLGFDSSNEVVAYIEDGLMAATVVQKPFNMGYLAVQAALDLLRGTRKAGYLDTGSNVVEKSNLYEEENQRLLFPAEVAPR